MRCTACGVYAEFEDGFCSVCGVEQPSSLLPVKRETSSLPAIWRDAVPVVARGAALVAAGVAAEFLLRSMARRAMPSPSRGKKSKAIVRKETALAEEIVAVSQTVITRLIIVTRR